MRKTRIHNPLNVKRDSDGKLRDKYGRVMKTDWDEFDKYRGKTKNVNWKSWKLK
jgi:streptogramin lyase